MPTFRTARLLVAATVTMLAAAAIGSAADESAPAPVVKLTAKVSPGRLPIPNGTPLTLTLDNRFTSNPPGEKFVLQHAVYSFGPGARINGKLFPSCSAARLRAAKGLLSACPEGSKIGSGVGVGTAVALGITSSGKITIFNGPGGRSMTMNINVIRPAAINATFSAPFTRLHGRYAFKLSAAVPDELKSILGGDIVVRRLTVTTGATRMIDGVKRGYFEALNCPPKGSAIRGDFTFDRGATASADLKVVC